MSFEQSITYMPFGQMSVGQILVEHSFFDQKIWNRWGNEECHNCLISFKYELLEKKYISKADPQVRSV
jgi:hypothetical protein